MRCLPGVVLQVQVTVSCLASELVPVSWVWMCAALEAVWLGQRVMLAQLQHAVGLLAAAGCPVHKLQAGARALWGPASVGTPRQWQLPVHSGR